MFWLAVHMTISQKQNQMSGDLNPNLEYDDSDGHYNLESQYTITHTLVNHVVSSLSDHRICFHADFE